MEILEWLRQELDCKYISDLHYGTINRLAKSVIRNAELSHYTLSELSDAASYLYDCNVKFETVGEARLFFEGN